MDIDNKFDIFLPLNEVKRKFRKRKVPFTIEVNWDEFQVDLKDLGNRTQVEITSLDGEDTDEAVVEVRSKFYGDLVDNSTISRVQAILDINPDSKFFKDIMADLKSGEQLGFRAEEILEETEDRMANLDPEIEAKLTKALAKSPTNSFLQSVERQFRSGFTLSDRQVSAIDKFLAPSSSKPSRSTPSRSNKFQSQSDRLDEALAIQSSSPFLKKLRKEMDNGRFLSKKQEQIVEDIIAEASAPETPLVVMLNDLESNGTYLTRDDYIAIRKGKRNVDSLSEDERKRLRHLVYKNGRRLQNSYAREDVRSMLKKARASAMRVASLYLSKR
tara:strand:- start:5083 stop:6069 length:987 start_codon:yes stop_codon:yes gene_type:complete